jgi:hypothetical protein
LLVDDDRVWDVIVVDLVAVLVVEAGRHGPAVIDIVGLGVGVSG